MAEMYTVEMCTIMHNVYHSLTDILVLFSSMGCDENAFEIKCPEGNVSS